MGHRKLEGHNIEAERLKNEADSTGRAQGNVRWEDILARVNVEGSFSVCFDCSFEDRLPDKEPNSLRALVEVRVC
jgi:hypothetical protein